MEIGYCDRLFCIINYLLWCRKCKDYSLELDEERAKQAQDFINQSAYKEQIEIILGDAAENIEKLE